MLLGSPPAKEKTGEILFRNSTHSHDVHAEQHGIRPPAVAVRSQSRLRRGDMWTLAIDRRARETSTAHDPAKSNVSQDLRCAWRWFHFFLSICGGCAGPAAGGVPAGSSGPRSLRVPWETVDIRKPRSGELSSSSCEIFSLGRWHDFQMPKNLVIGESIFGLLVDMGQASGQQSRSHVGMEAEDLRLVLGSSVCRFVAVFKSSIKSNEDSQACVQCARISSINLSFSTAIVFTS